MITDEQVEAIEALGAKYPGHYMAKFSVDPRRWDREAERLWEALASTDPVDRVLDIGCGFGYFLNVAGVCCVDAWGLDVPDDAIIEAVDIIEAKVVYENMEAERYLPSACRGLYDLITMFGCTLRHGHPATSKDYWGWPEYRFFFEDVLSRLRDGGRFVIRPNVMEEPEPHHANLLDPIARYNAIGDIARIDGRQEGQVTLRRKP